MIGIVDLFTPAAPGSLMRSCQVMGRGRFRLARRDAELYSVQIVSSGAWGRVRVMNADGDTLWMQPSTFTGSFWLSGFAAGGIIVESSANQDGDAINLTINWRERGRDVH